MSAFPTYNKSQIETLIYECALDLGTPGFDPYYGHGRIDGTNIFGPDLTPPFYLNLIESADPLILGNTENITINVVDRSGVNQVIINIEGTNHSMTNVGKNNWEFSSWIPSTMGNYSYTIYMEDNCDNWGFVSNSIQVINKSSDTTPPTYSNLIESADPLELGNTEVISIDVSDLTGINQVLIDYDGLNHSMINIEGDTWRHDSWNPSSIDIYPYTIYMEDNCNNWGFVSGSIRVIERNSDITPPTYSNLTESADPLILGNYEKISIDVTDPSGINQVLIHFEGNYHSMSNIIGDTWQYDSWMPSSIGYYTYTIYMEDNYNNWLGISGEIQVILGETDLAPPTYSNLIESADPLELGNTEKISIDVSDPSGVNQVLIEFEGFNHSMIKINQYTWDYSFWTPSSLGTYHYMIYMEDYYNNWGSVSGSIHVVDTTAPSCSFLSNSSEPLELGNSTAILIKATDYSGIKQVLFKYEGINYPMRDIGGDVWQFKQFSPSNLGVCNYTIYVEDNNNNWESISNSVEVIDSQAPPPPRLIRFPSGNVSAKIIFDWEDGYDPSGIKFYRVIIDNELNPFLTPGFIYEVNISNIGSESSFFELKESLPPGIYFFFIYQIDDVGHESSPATGEFVVTKTEIPQANEIRKWVPFLLILMTTSVIGVIGFVMVKKVKGKNIKPLNKEFEAKNHTIQIKNLRYERLNLEKEARKFVKLGNYARASIFYEKCKNISNDLFKLGIISEAEKAKYYANKGSKTFQIQEQEISLIRTNINAFLTVYFNKFGINYYSNPEIYPENQNVVNGLILNDAKFLHQILLKPKIGSKLIQELNIDTQSLTHFKAFQFIYSNDLSQQNISDYCAKYYNPEILHFIVSIKNVSKLELELIDALIQERDIQHGETIKCISYDSFANFLGLKGKNRNDFLKIIDFSKNFNSSTIMYHHTEELREILKQKKWYLFS
jgi:hypothetical protein